MRVIRKYSQHRRDCYVDLECENCGNKEQGVSAYDDRNMWDNVIPSWKCDECGESTNSLGIDPERIVTKYPEGFQV